MSDLRRFKRALQRIEPLAAVLREEGVRESDAMFIAAALLHSQPEDRLRRIRDLVREFPPTIPELLAVRLGRCTEAEFADLCRRTRAAEKVREMTSGAAQVQASYYTSDLRGR